MPVTLHVIRNSCVAHDVTDHRSSTSPQHAKNLSEQLMSVLLPYQIQHTVRNHAIDRIVGDQWPFPTKLFFQLSIRDPVNRSLARMQERRFAARCDAQIYSIERADSLRGVLTQFVQQSTGKAAAPQAPLPDYSVEVLYL